MTTADSANPAPRLVDWADYVAPFAIRAVCELRIADHMDGPTAIGDLAQATGTDATALLRVLRALAAREIFTEVSDRVFAIGPLGERLRSDHPRSVREAYPFLPADVMAWAGLTHTLRTGEPAFDHVHGQDYWRYMADHPDESRRFDESQRGVSRREAESLIGAYAWSERPTIIDVGGGDGTFLSTLLASDSKLTGTVLDQPHVVTRAEKVFADAGVSDRARAQGGSFLDGVPSGGEAYILKRVLYSWDEQDALRILRHVRESMDVESRVLIIEPLAEPVNAFDWGNFYDVLLLAMSGGGSRTIAQLDHLFEGAGLERIAIHRTRMLPIIEARATSLPSEEST